MLTYSDFTSKIRAVFPELVEEFEEDDLISLNVDSFRQFTQLQIDEKNREQVKLCFDLANEFYENGDQDLWSAISVAYLEHLDCNGEKQWAVKLMPPALFQGRKDVLQSLQDLHGTHHTDSTAKKQHHQKRKHQQGKNPRHKGRNRSR